MFARSVGHFVEVSLQGKVQDIAHQGTLATTRNSGDDREDVERKIHVDALQIISPSATHTYIIIPCTAHRGHGDLVCACQVSQRVRMGVLAARHSLGNSVASALPYHLSAVCASLGTDVYQIVGGTHDFLVVFDHNHRIAEVAQLVQDTYQSVCIARMQTNAGLVQDVERTDQRTAQRSSKVDALTLTSGKGIAEAVERQITQADINQEVEARTYLVQQTFGDLCIMFAQGEFGKERLQLADWHAH